MLNTDWGDHGHRNLMGSSYLGIACGAAYSWNPAAVDGESFLDRFVETAFGPSAAPLAKWMKQVDQSLHGPLPIRLYHALVEPLDAKKKPFAGLRPEVPARNQWWNDSIMIDQVDASGCASLVEGPCTEFPKINTRGMAEFERLAIAELKLAAEMNVVAAKRSLMGKEFRAGKAIPASQKRELRGDMQKMRGEFERLWMARNRPSRLCDNLYLMDRAIAELK